MTRLSLTHRMLACLVVVVLTANSLHAQGLLKRLDDDSPENIEKARLLGVLLYTRVSVVWEEKPLRDAMNELGEALNIGIVGRYDDDDPLGRGLAGDMPITLAARTQCALDLLEEALEQCEVYEDCTWQLRHGKVEIGSKRRLSAFSLRENRTYDITDLLIEPPYFKRDNSRYSAQQEFIKLKGPYIESILGESDREALRGGFLPKRKTPKMIMLEIVEGIVEVIEPGRWDTGGRSAEETPEDDGAAPAPTTMPASTAPQASPTRNPNLWATIRIFQKQLIIDAPDFIHRQVGGYPEAIKPAATEAEIQIPAKPKSPPLPPQSAGKP